MVPQVGGVRRIIVPVELGYPNNDMNSLGPKPLTFSVRLKALRSGSAVNEAACTKGHACEQMH